MAFYHLLALCYHQPESVFRITSLLDVITMLGVEEDEFVLFEMRVVGDPDNLCIIWSAEGIEHQLPPMKMPLVSELTNAYLTPTLHNENMDLRLMIASSMDRQHRKIRYIIDYMAAFFFNQ